MRETGMIWVLMATLAVMTAFAFVKSAEVQKGLTRQQAVLSRQATDAVQTTRAACTYRGFLHDEYRQGIKYLAQHPDGAPSLGISAAQIRQSVDKERRAYDALSNLVCTKVALAPPPAPRTTPATTTSR